MDIVFAIRDYQPSDSKLILSSFLGSWARKQVGAALDDIVTRVKCRSLSMPPKSVIINYYREYMNSLLDSDSVSVLVAHDPCYPDIIYGYSVLSESAKSIYFLFVKEDYRKRGLGLSLLSESLSQVGGKVVTLVFTSKAGNKLLEAYRGYAKVHGLSVPVLKEQTRL